MNNDDSLDQLFTHYPILFDLPPHLIQALQSHAQPVSASAGQTLFDLGSSCQSFLAITAGSVRVIKSSGTGHEILLYRIRPGGSCILTISCLLGQAVYSAQGVVEENLSGFAISRSLFLEIIDQSAAFRTYIFRLFADGLTHLANLVEAVTFGRLEQRLAALLLSKETPIVQTTHQMLADELGSTREVISRTLETFAARGILSLGRGKIVIANGKELHDIARVIV
jgi:CRP/FNR family transcriptional regulator